MYQNVTVIPSPSHPKKDVYVNLWTTNIIHVYCIDHCKMTLVEGFQMLGLSS